MTAYELNLRDTNEQHEVDRVMASTSQLDVPPIPPMPSEADCLYSYVGMCWVRPRDYTAVSFFGFSEFITALTLIAVVFTISDARYRFRISVAPIPLIPISFCAAVAIGLLVLLTDIWFAQRWVLPSFLASQVLWQGVLGGAFLVLMLSWIFLAFIRPARFGSMNARRYVRELYRILVRGDDEELPAIASELSISVRRIVDLGPGNKGQAARSEAPRKPQVEGYAHDLLLLIGNRKFCKHIVARSPGTAIQIFQALSETKKYHLPLAQFSRNISAEAIRNSDSILYHEDEGYKSGLLGYVKPFSAAVYGDYRLVEGLGERHGSPLDLDYGVREEWDAEKLKAYCRAVRQTIANYLTVKAWHEHSYSLTRAFHIVDGAFGDVYKLNDPSIPYYPSDIVDRLSVAVEFASDVIELLDKADPLPKPVQLRQRRRETGRRSDLYDRVARLMFELILAASHVRSDQDRAWSVQHNLVWSRMFPLGSKSQARRIVQLKLRRLIYDEITDMPHLNYQNSRVLGLSLSVLGFAPWAGQAAGERALQKVLIAWTKRNFSKHWNHNPDVVQSGLPANLEFDSKSGRLVKRYAKGLAREAPKDFLDLALEPSGQ